MGDNAEHARSQGSAQSAQDTDPQHEQMEITIDSQSFVNLGQLMGSRLSLSDSYDANGGGYVRNSVSGGGGGTSNATRSPFNKRGSSNVEALSSFISDGSQEEFDQIFHHPAGSSSGAWSGHDLCLDGDGDGDETQEEDDDESVLPALPVRSPTVESPVASGRGPSASSWNRQFRMTQGALGEGSKSRDDEDLGTGDILRPGPVTNSGSRFCEEKEGDEDLSRHETQRCSIDAFRGRTNSKRGADVEADASTENHLLGNVFVFAADQTEGAGVAAMTSAAGRAKASGGAESESDGTPREPMSYMRESWLHVPMDNSKEDHDSASESSNPFDQDQSGGDDHDRTVRGDWGGRAQYAATVLREYLFCFINGGRDAVALAKPLLEQLAQRIRVQARAGIDAVSRTQEDLVKAIDAVPQVPVRLWLARVAGSLVLGAILSGAAVYHILSRSTTAYVSSCSGLEATSPWWHSSANDQYCDTSAGSDQQAFVERLNKALFAARAGEAAAQQGLLEEVRNILAATGESGGISAERILRQFNAKRFTEASKAWSTAEGIAGADPLDPLFFAPPTTPIYKTNPSSSQQQHSASHPGAATTECSNGPYCSSEGAEGGFGNSRGYNGNGGSGGGSGGGEAGATNKRFHRRPCAGGGWVC